MSPPSSRVAGVLLPLFSMPSSRSWGVGEIGDISRLAGWLDSAGLRLLQLLPINEVSPDGTSPYSALSAMAIDPLFIGLESLEDFAAIGAEAALPAAERQQLDAARAAPEIDYAGVRRLKESALRGSFQSFRQIEWTGGTRRAAALRVYIREQQWWLDDYALFRALRARHGERSWIDWPPALRDRDAEALAQARRELSDEILYRQYLQWIADDQWTEARRNAANIFLFGDLPFMVSADSADVWRRQDEFRFDASIGVPPDAFSETGQDWGLPVYRWDVFAERDFEWLRDRARRYASLFDGYRVDHLVGFYRTYFRPHDGSTPQFSPAEQPAQVHLGEQVLEIFRGAGARVTAEDLGIVPDFVRDSLARLGVPGYKVFRWERWWRQPGQPFRDPLDYPAVAVATSGTHDTEPMVIWWEEAPYAEREAALAIASLRARLTAADRTAALDARSLPESLRQAVIETLYASGADLLILPIQDLFGWRDRINQPATVGGSNWRWRLPWPVDRMATEPVAMALATQLREWAKKYAR